MTPSGITRKSARDKGRRWTTAICRYLADEGAPHAEPRATNGAKDRGDVTGIAGVMIEAKCEAAPALGSYLRQVDVQTANAQAAVGVVWIKRPGRAHPAAGLVAMPMTSLYRLEFTGHFLPEVHLSAVLRDEQMVPQELDVVRLLKRTWASNAAAISGANFVALMKRSGWL